MHGRSLATTNKVETQQTLAGVKEGEERVTPLYVQEKLVDTSSSGEGERRKQQHDMYQGESRVKGVYIGKV